MSDSTVTVSDSSASTDALDAALNAALAKKSARGGEVKVKVIPAGVSGKVKTKATVKVLSDEDAEKLQLAKAAAEAAKVAAKAAKDDERAARKLERDAAREAKKLAKANKPPANMSKVDAALARLPVMGDGAQICYDEATTALDNEQIAALALHLQHELRRRATESSTGAKVSFELGQTVRIVNCSDARFIGKEAVITGVHRIRVHARVEGAVNDCYLFKTDVVPVELESEMVADEAPVAE